MTIVAQDAAPTVTACHRMAVLDREPWSPPAVPPRVLTPEPPRHVLADEAIIVRHPRAGATQPLRDLPHATASLEGTPRMIRPPLPRTPGAAPLTANPLPTGCGAGLKTGSAEETETITVSNRGQTITHPRPEQAVAHGVSGSHDTTADCPRSIGR
ncbi:hypothetical protein [Streptomyces litchfieldiae]|uniref:Uncharacterized protein n=1 Tax=Streptomyces litchfieldiae TaxID=3075543 RepID=A0ABU2MXP1_9ACTN|nr:hypothetical protein [Streptomyces sp. DSM 44938]MDT0346432.1 hypothetical protein [Streptomyces sp. DSM 44938]